RRAPPQPRAARRGGRGAGNDRPHVRRGGGPPLERGAVGALQPRRDAPQGGARRRFAGAVRGAARGPRRGADAGERLRAPAPGRVRERPPRARPGGGGGGRAGSGPRRPEGAARPGPPADAGGGAVARFGVRRARPRGGRVADAGVRGAGRAGGVTSTRESTGDGEALPAIDGFVVRRRIGEGGMGVVYEAEQVTPRRVVALKVARRGGRGGPEDLEPEADALALLSHPGVVPLLARGRTSDGASW